MNSVHLFKLTCTGCSWMQLCATHAQSIIHIYIVLCSIRNIRPLTQVSPAPFAFSLSSASPALLAPPAALLPLESKNINDVGMHYLRHDLTLQECHSWTGVSESPTQVIEQNVHSFQHVPIFVPVNTETDVWVTFLSQPPLLLLSLQLRLLSLAEFSSLSGRLETSKALYILAQQQ